MQILKVTYNKNKLNSASTHLDGKIIISKYDTKEYKSHSFNINESQNI